MAYPRHWMILGSVVASMAIVGHTLWDPHGWPRRQHVAEDLENRRRDNAALQARLLQLRRQIQAMKLRPDIQEQTVRDELGYVKPDDIVFYFDTMP